MNPLTGLSGRFFVATLLTALLLFMGVGRILQLVLHDPVLGYANNYEMIHIQACHDIWPAGKSLDLTRGTPAAPQRVYRVFPADVQAPCQPAAEILFSGTAIALANVKNRLLPSQFVSIKTVGLVKALVLVLTAVAFQVFFFRRQLLACQWVHALVVLVVLADPAVTLFCNGFYKEFSSIYFLYVALGGVVVLSLSGTSWPLLAGLSGLALSMPQHVALAVTLAVAMASYSLIRRQWRQATLVIMVALLAGVLGSSERLGARGTSAHLANQTNRLGGLLSLADNPGPILSDLALPGRCAALAGKNWYSPGIQQQHPCPEIAGVPGTVLAGLLLRHPDWWRPALDMAMPSLKEWVLGLYGHVEGRRMGRIQDLQWTLQDGLRTLAMPSFAALLAAPTAMLLLGVVVFTLARRPEASARPLYWCALLVLLQWTALLLALSADGLTDLAKHAHLVMPLVLTGFISSLLLPASLRSQP